MSDKSPKKQGKPKLTTKEKQDRKKAKKVPAEPVLPPAKKGRG